MGRVDDWPTWISAPLPRTPPGCSHLVAASFNYCAPAPKVRPADPSWMVLNWSWWFLGEKPIRSRKAFFTAWKLYRVEAGSLWQSFFNIYHIRGAYRHLQKQGSEFGDVWFKVLQGGLIWLVEFTGIYDDWLNLWNVGKILRLHRISRDWLNLLYLLHNRNFL